MKRKIMKQVAAVITVEMSFLFPVILGILSLLYQVASATANPRYVKPLLFS